MVHKKRVLHIIPSLSIGGIESLVVAMYENIDRSKFQFDFAVFNPNNPMHKEQLEELGANIYFIADAGSKSSVISKVLWRIKAIYNFAILISKNRYDVLHCHNYSNYGPYIVLGAIKGIPVRIVHSHTGGSLKESNFDKLIRRIKNKLNFEHLITLKVGCSNTASKWLYGKSSQINGKIKVIYNGIDMVKFKPVDSTEKRNIQKVHGMQQGIHFVHVARFTTAKNELFLIELFYEMTKLTTSIYLNFIGFGPLERKMKNWIHTLKIDDRVRFFDLNSNIPQLLGAMDYFLLPSLWEGFPITALEAQAAGLPIFISDTVTKEVDMGLATYLPIDKGAKFWAEKILELINSDTIPKKVNLEKRNQFDIKTVTIQFESLYN